MWILLILLPLLNPCISQILSFDNNIAVGSNQNFQVSWIITNRNSLIIDIISRQPGFFALMYSQSMTNSDLTAVEFVNGTALIRDYFSTNHSRPTIYQRSTVNTLYTATDGYSYIQARFERPFITNNPRDKVLSSGSEARFALAWNNNNSMVSFHGRNIAYINGILLNNTNIAISSSP